MRVLWAACLAMLPVLGNAQEAATTASGAMLRMLDKSTGRVTDIEIRSGQQTREGMLDIALLECRYPEGDIAGDAFAHVVIHDTREDAPVFSGWMVASSPALNALDHPRFDVWVLRCITS